jgi:hypothetical protein
MISARLRDGSGWTDARILNMSARGMLLNARSTPEQGSYIEVCKGPHRMVGRVVWVRQDRFGICTQDTVPLDAITAGKAPAAATVVAEERQAAPPSRSATERLERSRSRARAMQFLFLASFGAAAAALAFEAVKGALARPLSVATAELVRAR